MTRTHITGFETVGDIIAKAANDLFAPPERLTVSQSSAKYRKLNNPGSYVGDWQNSTAPYMVEPMDVLTSPFYSGEIFVGPAQCGKTDSLILNWTMHSVIVDPMDMMIVTPTQAVSRDFSTRRISRLHRHTKEVGARLIKQRDADNKFDKQYDTGMMLNLSWPTISELSGRPIPRMALTDVDRMPDDVEGEGSPFDLATKRTTTFGSFAMTLAESSPSREVKDPKWVRSTPHEAPPCEGILALYNRGDRRRWYWPCPNCDQYFEGRFPMLVWDKSKPSHVEQAETVRLKCPHCTSLIHPDDRHEMQQWGVWLADGQVIHNGKIFGERPRAGIASFWLNGIAAAFTSWQKLVLTYLDAQAEFERTGSEEALKKFWNTDLGEPYLPKSMESERTPKDLQAKALPLPEKQVPDDVRMLVATVDVQKNMFKVQVHGVLPGIPFDTVVIDRFDIRKSKRLIDSAEHDFEGEHEWVKPGTYLEDWELITEKVIHRTYPLADDSGRRMMIRHVGCDSGGKAGVTSNAYAYYRSLRALGLSNRFHLIKGEHKPGAPRARVSYPDSSNRGNKAAAQGDVPVLMLQSNQMKDMLSNLLDSIAPGKGMIRFPDWLPEWFYHELCSEYRDEKGWQKLAHQKNEAWDLLYYYCGLLISQYVRIEQVDWSKPPAWAETWDKNPMVLEPDNDDAVAHVEQSRYDFSKLGSALA